MLTGQYLLRPEGVAARHEGPSAIADLGGIRRAPMMRMPTRSSTRSRRRSLMHRPG